jgi:hypothetical protein
MPPERWSGSTPRRCKPSSSSATGSTPPSSSRSSTPCRRRSRQGHRADVTRTGRAAVGARLAGGVRGEDPRRIAPAGVNHTILAMTDSSLVKAFTGMDIDGVADVNTQLQLIRRGDPCGSTVSPARNRAHRRVLPAGVPHSEWASRRYVALGTLWDDPSSAPFALTAIGLGVRALRCVHRLRRVEGTAVRRWQAALPA